MAAPEFLDANALLIALTIIILLIPLGALLRIYIAKLEHPLCAVRFATQLQDESRQVCCLQWFAARRMRCFSSRGLRKSSAVSRAVEALQADGACVVANVLSEADAAGMAAHVDESVAAGLATLRAGLSDGTDEFSKIEGYLSDDDEVGGAGMRLQRALPLSSTVRDAMRHALASLGPVLRSALGPHAVLWELACIVAQPGAPQQKFHRDAGEPSQEGGAGLYSVFIALQDVTPASGPTVLLPRSHSDAAVAADPALRDAEARYLAARQRAIDSVGEVDMRLLADAEHAARRFRTFNRAPLLRRGDALIYDSRLRHCGSANVSAAPRRLFNFGFAAAGAAEAGHLRGHTATLSAELYGACSLDEDPATCWPHGAS